MRARVCVCVKVEYEMSLNRFDCHLRGCGCPRQSRPSSTFGDRRFTRLWPAAGGRHWTVHGRGRRFLLLLDGYIQQRRGIEEARGKWRENPVHQSFVT